ncbi:endonuclease MutS2 [candidate division KSB3 bacterium]|uniref:Endonuclease MutS2 n=1 Tax=candidate division KSB3 bacterium TaxID=2044937 RepID=A0A2G6EAM6_9BACT|nr:MAG: endonuclease MutS2 [candidate division KSB3 bacterium]PIE30698.1 MAG: endonuclease MutS2 [candidate division KSB3 bacterium]
MEFLTEQALEFDTVKEYLAQFALSLPGKQELKDLRPLTDRERIEILLTEISELKDIRAVHGHLPLETLEDIREPLRRSRVDGAILEPLELRQIYNVLYSGRGVKQFVDALDAQSYPCLRKKVESIVLIEALERAIARSVDEEGAILDSASQKLRQIRKELRIARESIQRRLQTFFQRQDYQGVLQDHVITMRHNRYVIPVKAASKGKIKGIVHDQSSSGMTVFIEPQETVELNNRLASIEADEKAEIRRILLDLSGQVAESRVEIEETLIALGELDCINAKTRLSERWNCCQPELCERKQIVLQQARHPLLLMQNEADPSAIVPLLLRFDDDFSTLLITGPNTGGKTVSLKTVGLLAMMTQAGLHIPAEKGSKLCVFDNIFADIGDQQSIEQNLSTFSSHVTHIVKILEQANDRSLVLLDELGAGTDPAEGASLGIAILEYLDANNAKCLATTHHDALKSYAYTQTSTLNACMEFDVDSLSPTYRLLVGMPGKSNAFVIAERLGLPGHVIRRAQTLMGEDLLQVDRLIRKLTKDSEELDRKKRETDAKYRGILRLEKESDLLMRAAEKEKQRILDTALRQAKNIVDDAIRQSQETVRSLPAAGREQGREKLKSLQRKASELHKALRTTRKVVNSTPSAAKGEPVTVGAKVRMAGLERSGSVLRFLKDGKHAEVQVGMMRLEVPVDQLSLLQQAKSSSEHRKVSISDFSAHPGDSHTLPLELVLVGKRIDEALDELNGYLDRAFLSGLPSVSIVHGIGTGKLKKAVASFLRSHPHVLEYALDNRNYGMTNVRLACCSPPANQR